MTYHDDDELDRALFALPLAPLPAGLRESILAATLAPAAVPLFRPWEIGGIGVILGLVTWLCLLAARGQLGLGTLGLGTLVTSFGAGLLRVTSDTTLLMWLGVGIASALALTMANPSISFARTSSGGRSR